VRWRRLAGSWKKSIVLNCFQESSTVSTGARILLSVSVSLSLIAGCSRSSGPKLAAADGTVKLQGQPLPNATVMFVPEKGPVAMAVTDMEGKFQLRTGASRGVVVGPVKVAVTANTGQDEAGLNSVSQQPKTPEEAAQYLKNANELQQKMAQGKDAAPKSLIPEKYNKTESSGLSYTINADGKNHFDIELK
jgi:hypothetical protein